MTDNLSTLNIVLVVRDMLQSFGIKGVMHHPRLLEIYSLVSDFNKISEETGAAPIRLVGLEGFGGALPQLNMMQGRGHIFRPLIEADKALPEGIPQRLLVRGPFGVRLDAMHKDDLEFLLTNMVEAGGSKEGRTVILKLFEAQNTVAEHTKTLEIIRDLRKAGYDVQVELAVCYTASAKLNEDYYYRTASDILDNAIRVFTDPVTGAVDHGAIAGISLKDMIGMLEPEQAPGLERVFERVINEKAPGIYFAIHSHEQETVGGVVAAQEAHRASANPVEYRFDALPGEFGFPNLFEVCEKLNLKLSLAQEKILRKMESNLSEFVTEYGVDTSVKASFWTREQRVFARIPGGAVPTDRDNNVKPVHKALVKALATSGQKVMPEESDRLLRVVADLFIHVHHQIAIDCGEAHSVTPAAKHLGFLAMDVMNGMIADETFRNRLVKGEIDLSLNSREVLDVTSNYYSNIQNADAIHYFRGQMPYPIAPNLMAMFSTPGLRAYFNSWLDGMRGIVGKVWSHFSDRRGQEYWPAFAMALAPDATNKSIKLAVLQTIFKNEITKRPNFLFGEKDVGELRDSVIYEVNKLDVTGHVEGKRETLFDAHAKSNWRQLKKLIEEMPGRDDRISLNHAVCFALLYGNKSILDDGTLNPAVMQSLQNPIDRFPTYWGRNAVQAETPLRADEILLFDTYGINNEEKHLIDILRANNVRTLLDLLKKGDAQPALMGINVNGSGEYSSSCAVLADHLYGVNRGTRIANTYIFANYLDPKLAAEAVRDAKTDLAVIAGGFCTDVPEPTVN